MGAGEVEAALLAQDAVAEAAVVGGPDDDLGQRIIAYVAPRRGERLEPIVVATEVARRLCVHKRPREVRVVDAPPRNAMGKVVKTDLS